MSASHATAQREQGVPFTVSRHFVSLITGSAVLLKRPTRFMSAASGQKRVHHLRSTNTSTMSMSGTSTAAIVMSPNANRRHTKSTVANVRPTGQTRQNTGKPKIAVDSSAPPST